MKYYLQMDKYSVCIMFPNNSTSIFLGQTLISDLANVSFFIPEGIHEQAAFTCYEEVKLSGIGLDVSVTKITKYQDLAVFDYLVFPRIDVNPRKTRKEFITMCRNLFK